MNQREAVFSAVVAVVGEVHGKVELDKDQKDQVYDLLFKMFTSGEVDLKGDRSPDYIKKYIPGLVNNWLRKDKALNGGVEYVAKNPGSRAGSGDQTLKAMKQLLTTVADPEARAEIEQAIQERLAMVKPKPTINIQALPPELRRFVK